MEWMILPLRRYAEFSGRSRRKEFWMFVLFTTILSIVLAVLDSALGLGGAASSFSDRTANGVAAGASASGGVLSSIASLLLILPSIAVSVRRLHDIDRSGWWLLFPYGLLGAGAVLSLGIAFGGGGIAAVALPGLLMFAGGIGMIVLLVWACMDGTRGGNRFGPDPKAAMPDLEETFR